MNANINCQIEKNIHRKEVLVSVIIPAHNAEKTLRRAVESALHAMSVVESDATLAVHSPESEGRRLPVYEILIIENTSEDGTVFLGKTLQAENPETVRFFQSDPGVSCARNRGLEEAKGEWILFLDSDDYFLEGAGEVLRDALHFTGTDLIVHSYESGDRVVHVCGKQGERFAGKDLDEIRVRMIENPTRYTAVWSKLFRRARIEYGKLRFDPSLRLSEDSHFLIRYLVLCRRIRLFDRAFYHYSTDNASAVRTWDGKKEEGYRSSLLAVQSFLKTQPDRIRSAFAGYGMMQFNLLMVREVFAAGKQKAGAGAPDRTELAVTYPYSMGDKIRRMIELSREEPFSEALQGYDSKRHKGARYLPVRLLRSGMAAGAAAVYEARVLQNARKERMH